jgi:hypothetical protein
MEKPFSDHDEPDDDMTEGLHETPATHMGGANAIDRQMPFGKYKGTRIEEVPDDYLCWLKAETELREPLRSVVDRELQRRRNPDAAGPKTPAEIIEQQGGIEAYLVRKRQTRRG